MSNELRDELAAATEEANARYKGDWDEYNQEPVDDWGVAESERRAFVAGALFAFERCKPRIITTVEELDALPLWSVVLDPFSAVCVKFHQRRPFGWRRMTLAVEDGAGHWHTPFLPATVIHEGDK